METFIFCAVNKPNESISIASATQEVNEGCKSRWRTVGQRLTTEYQLCVVSLKITKKTTMSLISQNLTEYWRHDSSREVYIATLVGEHI